MTLVNHDTGEVMEPMSADDARRLTERIRIAAANYAEAKTKVLTLVDEAKAGAAHISLGYKSWTAYLSDVLSDEPLRLAREERRELAVKLADEGMGPQLIAPILGVSHMTVHRDLRESDVTNVRPDGTPAPVVRTTTDRDGRQRTTVSSGAPQQSRRRPLPDAARDAGWDLRKAVERLERLVADDRFGDNAEQVATHLRSHLINAVEVCQGLIDRINNN